MIEQIDTMSKVANAFSDFATLPEPKVVEEDIVEITSLATEIFESSNIKFITSSKSLLWPIDRTQWIRVLTNLIQNAIQAVPQGREPKIEVRLTHQKHQLNIQIMDNGSGISSEDFHRIFEPKFTTKTGGMGLGLAIVKNIIDSFNGSIDFTSSMTKGTTFSIKLINPSHDI